jgi:hypothetical protein
MLNPNPRLADYSLGVVGPSQCARGDHCVEGAVPLAGYKIQGLGVKVQGFKV